MKSENKKLCVLFLSIVFICMLFGCASTRVQNNGTPATAVRTELDGLRTEQAESARTGERIKGESEEIERICGELTGTITDGEDYCNELRKILDEIRGREQQLTE